MNLEAGRRELDNALAAVTVITPRATNMRRMAIVLANHPNMVAAEIQAYITGRGYWERNPGQIWDQENG
jgi:hypothetical protein